MAQARRVEAKVDIAAWLRSLGLEQYEPAFHENAVDAGLLPRLTSEDLKDIGVISVGHRRRMLDAIAVLQSEAAGARQGLHCRSRAGNNDGGAWRRAAAADHHVC